MWWRFTLCDFFLSVHQKWMIDFYEAHPSPPRAAPFLPHPIITVRMTSGDHGCYLAFPHSHQRVRGNERLNQSPCFLRSLDSAIGPDCVTLILVKAPSTAHMYLMKWPVSVFAIKRRQDMQRGCQGQRCGWVLDGSLITDTISLHCPTKWELKVSRQKGWDIGIKGAVHSVSEMMCTRDVSLTRKESEDTTIVLAGLEEKRELRQLRAQVENGWWDSLYMYPFSLVHIYTIVNLIWFDLWCWSEPIKQKHLYSI